MEKLIAILENLNGDVNYHIEEDLINNGIFSSFEILQCITEVEEEFGIIIPPQEIMPENFSSAVKIWEMIQRCKAN